MKVLVTGATGGLGRNLINHLLENKYEVTATGRNQEIGKKLQLLGVDFLPSDLADKEKIISMCKGQQFVFHCGALSSVWGKYKDFYSANVIGTKNIIEGCLKHNVQRLIYTSTPSIYFNFKEKFSIQENMHLPKPVNYYAATKGLAEKEIDVAFVENNLPVVTIRPRAIFGPYDASVIPRIIRAADRGKLPLMYDGKAIIDITFVANVVDSLMLCTKASNHVLGKKYNITNGEPIEFLCLMKKLFVALKRPLLTRKIPFPIVYTLAYAVELLYLLFPFRKEPPFTRYSVGVVSIGQTLDITAAKKDLLYEPRISIDEGLKRYVEWLENND